MEFAIATDGLRKKLGGRTVIDDLALRVPPGDVYGFIGPNGAGKTTAMRLLLGLIRRDAGDVSILGRDLDRDRIGALAETGAFIEHPGLYDHLSGRANIELYRRQRGLAASETDRVLEVAGMTEHANRKAGQYSLGMRQRTALARTLLGNPKLLMLDEPTNGLDPEGIQDMRELIRALPERTGATVFLSSHLLAEIEQVAKHAGLIRDGKLVLQGPLDELLGGGGEAHMTVDDPKRAAAVLGQAGWAAETIAADQIAVRGASATPGEIDTATANRLLVEAGIAVSAIARPRSSLEDLYRRSTAAQPAGDAQ